MKKFIKEYLWLILPTLIIPLFIITALYFASFRAYLVHLASFVNWQIVGYVVCVLLIVLFWLLKWYEIYIGSD